MRLKLFLGMTDLAVQSRYLGTSVVHCSPPVIATSLQSQPQPQTYPIISWNLPRFPCVITCKVDLHRYDPQPLQQSQQILRTQPAISCGVVQPQELCHILYWFGFLSMKILRCGQRTVHAWNWLLLHQVVPIPALSLY